MTNLHHIYKRNVRPGRLIPGMLVMFGTLVFAGMDNAALAASGDDILEEILVTAQRRAESVQDVPISMTVFSGDDLNNLNIISTGELGAQVPNLRMYNDTGENGAVQVVIRGVYSAGQTYMAGPAALVYSDDLVLDSYLSQGLAFFDAERVEVLRGPQGTLFGRNATAGAAQVISKRPGEEWEGYGGFTYGSYDRTRFEGAVGGPLSDKAGVRVSGFYDRKDGWFDNIHTGEELYDADNYALRGILEFAPTEDINLFFKVQYAEQDQHPLAWQSSFPDPHAFTGAGLNDALLPNPGPASDFEAGNISFRANELEDSFKDTQLGFTLNWDLGNVRLTSISGYEDYEFSFINDADSTGTTIFHFFNGVKYDGFTQELRLTSDTDSPFQWIVGGFYSNQDMDSRVSDDFTDLYVLFGIVAPGTGFGDMDSIDHKSKSYAVFVHTDYQWTDKFKTTHGVRYTRDEFSRIRTAFDFTVFPRTSDLSFVDLSLHADGGSTVPGVDVPNKADTEEVTWRIAAEYAARDDLLLYASISTGYKAGLLGAIFNTLTNQYVFVDPETVISYELGFKSQWLDNRFLVNAAGFYYDYQDYQTFTTIGNQFMFSRSDVNIPETSFIGFEVELSARPVDNLLINLGVGYVDGEIDRYVSNALVDLSGNKPARTSDLDVNGLLRYDIPIGANGVLSPQFDFDYVGDYFPDIENSQRLGDYWRFNARLGYQHENSGISANLFVKNIGDEKELQNVFAPNDSFGLGTDIHTRDLGRTFGVSIRKDF